MLFAVHVGLVIPTTVASQMFKRERPSNNVAEKVLSNQPLLTLKEFPEDVIRNSLPVVTVMLMS